MAATTGVSLGTVSTTMALLVREGLMRKRRTDGALKLVSGELPVAPGEVIGLELHYDGLVAGPTRCRGFWYVDGVLGGDETVGTVDACGTYTAPATPPDTGSVRVEAAEYPLGGCADCCPWASRTIPLE